MLLTNHVHIIVIRILNFIFIFVCELNYEYNYFTVNINPDCIILDELYLVVFLFLSVLNRNCFHSFCLASLNAVSEAKV